MRRIVRTIGAAAALGAAALGMEALYAGLRRLPEFDGHDASGKFGDKALPPLNLVVLGDSACTGPGLADANDIWLRVLARRLGDRFHVTLTSLAVGGARAHDVARAQVPRAIELHPDLAFVVVGSNDMLHGVPAAVFERNLDRIVAALTPVSRLVVLAGIGDLGTIPRLPAPLDRIARGRARQGDTATATVAARHGAVKADMWALTTHQFRTFPDIFSPDLFHPSPVGHLVWAEAAWVTIEPHLDAFAGSPA